MTSPVCSVNPSAGCGAQSVVSTVTADGFVQTGGVPTLGRPKANASRIFARSHAAFSPLAIQAGGTPPLAESSPNRGRTLGWPIQSNGDEHTFRAPAPVPIVRRPPNADVNMIAVALLGVATPVRSTREYGCSGPSPART